MEYFKLHCSVRSRSVRLWRDDLHDHRGGLRRCLDPKVGQEGLNILEDQINGIELTKKLVNIVVVVYKTIQYSNVGQLFCTPAPPKFTKKLAVDSFFNFGS